MPTHAVVWDLETVPDLKGFAAANDLVSKSDDEIREARWATSFPNTSFIRLPASADIDQGQCPIWVIRDRSIQRHSRNRP
jgi:hypothetical protein